MSAEISCALSASLFFYYYYNDDYHYTCSMKYERDILWRSVIDKARSVSTLPLDFLELTDGIIESATRVLVLRVVQRRNRVTRGCTQTCMRPRTKVPAIARLAMQGQPAKRQSDGLNLLGSGIEP